MSCGIRPRKVPMWQFFNQNVGAAGAVRLDRFEDLGAGDRKVAELFIAALKGSRAALDIGCGTGLPALYVAGHVGKVVGLDAAPNMIAAARQNAARLGIQNVSFQLGGAEGLPFGNEEFDGASLCGVLESMDWEGVQCAMRELRRVLEPGGRIAVLDRDWRYVIGSKPAREAHIRREKKHLVLQIVERTVSPHVEKDTRHLVGLNSPSGRRLKEELGDQNRAATTLSPDELKRGDILDAWYDQAAQFDARTLTELLAANGFHKIKADSLPIWKQQVLFLTAIK